MKGRMSSTIHSDVSPSQLEEVEKKLEADEKALEVGTHSVHLWTFAKVIVAFNFSRTSYVMYTVEPPKTNSPYYGNLHNADKSLRSRIIPYTIVYVLRKPPY